MIFIISGDFVFKRVMDHVQVYDRKTNKFVLSADTMYEAIRETESLNSHVEDNSNDQQGKSMFG